MKPLASFLLGAALAAGALPVAGAGYQRSVEAYRVPDVRLVDQDGAPVALRGELEADRPVLLEFIFTDCTTICPILSAGFHNFQERLGADAGKARLVSISIDPENDTPPVMSAYLKRYRAKPGWKFLTGNRQDIEQVMRAFGAYVPNKMSHFQLTFIRSPRDGSWVRLSGMLGAADLLAECRKAGLP